MNLGIIILAHEHLHRAAQLANHLADNGCFISIHVDQICDDSEFDKCIEATSKNKTISYTKRSKCTWGQFSLVEATKKAINQLTDNHPDLQHIMLLSGSCLPLRPISEIKSFLSMNHDVDFIESVPVGTDNWIMGGLGIERFTLYFPFKWRSQRFLFEAAVKAQRFIKTKRKIPDDLEIYIGSQWWCLTRKTIDAIMNDSQRPSYDKFYKSTWIPDESYFQTLARKHSDKILSTSLTFSKFDRSGKPYLIYDDHLEPLTQSQYFFARKVWPKANRLYEYFLTDEMNKSSLKKDPYALRRLYEHVEQHSNEGRSGRFMPGYFPKPSDRLKTTHRRYSVFFGFDHICPNFGVWVEGNLQGKVFSHIFKIDENASLKNNLQYDNGNQVLYSSLSQYRSKQFLSNLIWNEREYSVSLLQNIDEAPNTHKLLQSDPNAQVFILRGGWIADPKLMSYSDSELVDKVTRYQAQEEDLITGFSKTERKTRMFAWDVTVFIRDPHPAMKVIKTFHTHNPDPKPLNETCLETKDISKIMTRLKHLGVSV